MSAQLTKDTAPELAIRKLLHTAGLRYRVNHLVLPKLRRRADIAFTRRKVAVFVDGCFWHGCADHGTQPKTNAEWWSEKLAKNVTRDRETDRLLGEAGWIVLRIWEHEDLEEASKRIIMALQIGLSVALDNSNAVRVRPMARNGGD